MGRPQFATAGTRGGGQHVAAQERPEVHAQQNPIAGPIGSGSAKSVTFNPPQGSVYKFLSLAVSAPTDADWTSGDHLMRIYSMDQNLLLFGHSDSTAALTYTSSEWSSANQDQKPASATAQWGQETRIRATNGNPVRVEYSNFCDAPQENDVTVEAVWEEVSY